MIFYQFFKYFLKLFRNGVSHCVSQVKIFKTRKYRKTLNAIEEVFLTYFVNLGDLARLQMVFHD